VQRVYAVKAGEDDLAVVEIENQSSAPFAVAFAVRPYNPEGLAVVERIALLDRTVTVDRTTRAALSRPADADGRLDLPRRRPAEIVISGRAGDALPAPLRCEVASRRLLSCSLSPIGRRSASPCRWLASTGPSPPAHPSTGEQVPDLPPSVPTGQSAAGRLAGPDPARPPVRVARRPVGRAVDANRRFLLLLHDGDEITPGPYTYHRFWFRDAAYLLAALDRYGFHAEAAEVLRSYPRRQHIDGFFFSSGQELGCQRFGDLCHGRALAAHGRRRVGGRAPAVGGQGRALDRSQTAFEAAPQ